MKTRYLVVGLLTGTVLISAGPNPIMAQSAAPASSASAATSSSSAAQAPPFTPPTNLEKGEQLFRQGMDAKKQEDWAKALDLFKQAQELMPHWMVVANLGEVELKLGRGRDAAEHLDWALEEASKTKNDVSALQILQGKLDQAKAKVVTVQLKVGDSGVDLYVDGVFVGKSPKKRAVYVEPGRRLFEGRWGSGKVVKEEIEFAKGGMAREVRLGGEKRTGAVESGGSSPAKWEPPWWSMVVGGALGAVGIGIGTTFTLMAQRDANEAKSLATSIKTTWTNFDGKNGPTTMEGYCEKGGEAILKDCTRWNGLQDQVEQKNLFSAISFIAGGAFLGATAGLATYSLIKRPRQNKKMGHVEVRPIVGPTQHGFKIEGTF